MKKFMIGFVLTIVLCLSIASLVFSQGCIPVRNIAGFGQFSLPQFQDLDAKPIQWMVTVNNRYFGFNKKYVGSDYVYQAPEDRNQNRSFTTEIAITRILNNGWSLTLDLPITASSRTNWQEHDPTTMVKYTTSTFGINDIRITAYKWLLSVQEYHKGNIQIGFGLKLPTGNYKSEDYFHRPGGLKALAPVNQSIQLGDGGTGIILELNSFYTVSKMVSVYGNLYYLISPRDQNGTSTLVGVTPPDYPDWVASGRDVTSVPDAFTIRGGANFTANKFVFWSGVRLEGQPVHDLVGESNGQRRPGKIVSFEPGVNYTMQKSVLFAFVPVPIYREVNPSVADIEYQKLKTTTIQPVGGGFADYMVIVGVLFKI